MGMSSGTGKGSRVAMSEINVTPLVDVMLVLLIIFMVTAPMMQQGLQVDLPETATSGAATTDEPLVLVIKKNGGLSIAGQNIDLSTLQKRLAAIFSTRKNKDVYLQADRSVNYGIVAETIGEVKSSGASSISLITLPK